MYTTIVGYQSSSNVKLMLYVSKKRPLMCESLPDRILTTLKVVSDL